MSVRTSAIHELASSFSRIHLLPRLASINLTFYGKWHNPDSKGSLVLQASILDALVASFGVRAPSKLTSLSLHNLCSSVFSSPALDSSPFQTVLMTLRRFHFWGTLFTCIVLAPMQASLTELTLHSDAYVGASSGLSFRELHFPHLCALSLRNLIFDRSIGAEDFILRHAVTLARLELLMCKLLNDADSSHSTSPSSSTTSKADEESSDGPSGWDRIWDRFEAELTALVVLHVDERRRDPWGNATLECRYVDPGPCVSFWEADAPEPRNVADAEALRRFRMTVAARTEEARGTS